MKKRVLSLLLALIMAVSLLPVSVLAAEAQDNEGVVTNVEILFSANINGVSCNFSLPNFSFTPSKKEYNITIPDTWANPKIIVTTTEDGEGKDVTLSINGTAKTPIPKIKDKRCETGFPMAKLISIQPGNTADAILKVGDDKPYTFHIIRSCRLNTFDVFSDEGGKTKINLNPSYNMADITTDNTFTLTLPKGTEAVWLKLAARSKKNVALFVNNAEYSGSHYKLDLTGLTPDSNGIITVPVEERYTGEEGKGEGSKYTLNIRFVDYMPIITTQPKAMEIDKGQTATLSVDAQCTEGTLTYQWYCGNTGGLHNEKPIEGATGKTLDVTSPNAGSMDYLCYVTNTVDGVPYLVKSDRVRVKTKLNYITPATITEFSGGGECIEGQENQLKLQYTFEDAIYCVNQKVEWYRNTVNSTTGGVLVKETTEGGTVAMPGEPAGTYYYYCVVTLLDKEGKASPVTTTSSQTLTIKYKPYGDLIRLNGAGTETNPYKITSLDDLQEIRSLVEQGYHLQNQHFLLTSDITLPADWKPIGKLAGYDASLAINNIDEDTQGSVYSFTGKGTAILPFSGILDGDGHTVTIAEGGLPLFGIVREAEVRNLNIYGKKIASNGLVHNYTVDYGTDGDYNTGVPKTILIDNVTLKEGSSTLYSGFIGGYASGSNTVVIRNSVVEKGVTIGYDSNATRGFGNQSIGSFAGDFNGTITNCVSYATVNGENNVGGLVGRKGQSMGPCIVQNSRFFGAVNASGNWAGGILGSGYYATSAPNTPIASVKNCLVAANVTGKDNVGGIFGGEPVCEDCWDNGKGGVRDNVFYGTVQATAGNNVGGIIGFMKSVNENVTIENNYYLNTCGANKVVGKTEIIDDAEYSDARCGKGVTAVQMCDGSIVKALNRADSSFKNWIQGEKYPTISDKPVVYELVATGTVKQHYIGDALDLTGITLTATRTDGESINVPLNDSNLKITGFDSSTRGQQTVTLSYGAAKVEITVTVLLPAGKDITVSFMLLGDSAHGDSGDKHTLADNNLETWIDTTKVTVSNNATVLDVILAVCGDKFDIKNESGNYIQAITPKDGTELAEFTNGNLSGWMYTLNGVHPNLGVAQQYLNEGDVIVFHYTDDYLKEYEAEQNRTKTAEEVIAMIDAIGTVDLSKAGAISAARSAYDKLTDAEKALVTNYDVLVEAEAEYARLAAEQGKKLDNIYTTTGDYISALGTPGVGSVGGEWMTIGLARSGRTVSDGYYDAVVEYVKANADANERLHRSKSTDNSRIILALTSLGKDVTNVGGHNLLKGLDSMDYLQKQGINGPIWALIALDSHDYPTSGDVTREKLIQVILDAQLPDGGWTLGGETADVDMTAMAIQALAPYYKENDAVKAAVDKALDVLSELQLATGGFGSWGTVNSESCAQVIVALTALGIDPATDSRFVKNGLTVLGALAGFYVDGGGFKHIADGNLDGMATEQGYYALAAYYRFVNGQTSLYDMSDVTIQIDSHTHDFGAWTVTTPATCTADGVETRSCACGETETRNIPATGHTFGEWTVTTPATCTADGVETRSCACGETETCNIPATGHVDADHDGKCDVCQAVITPVDPGDPDNPTPVDPDDPTPDNPDDPGKTDPADPGKTDPADPGTDKPATGDAGVLVWVVALPTAALAAAFVLGKKKREA